jgi:Flp pilus assembly pilin Flp
MVKKKVLAGHKGQGIVEYVLVTALVALAAVAVFKTFREDVKEAYRRAGQSLIQGVTENASAGGTE